MKALALLLLLAPLAHAETATTVDELAQLLAKNPGAHLNSNTAAKNQPVEFEVTVGTTTYSASAPVDTFFTAVRAAAPVTTIQSGNLTLVNDYGRLTVQGQQPVVYDVANDVRDNQYDPSDFPGENPTGNVGVEYKLLSVVGDLVSYSRIGDQYGPGAAHPNYEDTIATADLGTINKNGDWLSYAQADLGDQVDETSLVRALQADRFLRSKIRSKRGLRKVLAARNLQELGDAASDALQGSCYSLPVHDGKLTAFAIYDYDAAKNLVTVRVPMGSAAHVCDGEAPTKQLGLTLKPRIDLELALRAMGKAKTGLLMKNVH